MFKNQTLLLLSYTVGLALVLAVGRMAFVAYRTDPSEALAEQQHSTLKPITRPTDASRDDHAYVRALDRIREMQSALDKSQQLLKGRTELLNRKTAQNDALQRELNESLDFFLSVLAEDDEFGEEERVTALRELQSELTDLRTALAESVEIQREQFDELATIEEQLTETNAELLASRLEAEAELNDLYQDQAEFKIVLAEILAGQGESAVDTLIPLLADERAAVRQWTAYTLGQIGLDAEKAAPGLRILTGDSDPQVRRTAQDALNRVLP